MAAISLPPPTSSRIFVKNLPPNIREEDFQKHFAQLAKPTDIKLIPRRRIGYVGYRSGEEAAKAVKYFNRSFIRMSKIGVELARPVEQWHRESRHEQIDSIGTRANAEQVTGPRFLGASDNAEKPSNAKLDEFLRVMAPTSKSKTWANEDTVAVAAPAPMTTEIVDITEGGSEDEYQTVSRKRKRSMEKEDESLASRIKSSRHPSPEQARPAEAAKTGHHAVEEKNDFQDMNMISRKKDANVNEISEGSAIQTSAHQPEDMAIEAQAPVSDSDWLRSKTSRVLGLVDDDEFDAEGKAHPANKEPSRVEQSEVVEQADPSAEPSGSDAMSQTVEEIRTDNNQAVEHDLSKVNAVLTKARPIAKESTGRLFVRNLTYNATEPELQSHFSSYGTIEEVHISRDTRSGSSKGFGYVQFGIAEEAKHALEELDGKSFQGRLLHVLPADVRKETGLDEYAISKLPLKKQQQYRRKAEASKAYFKWNSMYMNPDAIVATVADRLGISKSEVLDPTSTDAAVKKAHAEANVIQEAKNYFARQGVDLDAFKKKEMSDRAILVKNFPYGTTAEEIKKLFEKFGSVTKMLMPPSATIAIVEMEQPTQARSAFPALAYSKFKESVLFLERAPKGIFEGQASPKDTVPPPKEGKLSTSELLEQQDAPGSILTSTLFVGNLNFSTTSEDLRALFKPLPGLLSARVKTKMDPKNPNQFLSMGFGFVEFRSKAEARSALTALNGYTLAGHDLTIKESHKTLDAAEERRKEDLAKKLAGRRTKIIVKNLPFEATKKDVRALFGPHGQLKSVRVPKKFDNSSRGFAFADFATVREAENAMKALEGVHLLGRRLNLDFASEESIDPEEEIEKMQKKVGKQTDKIAIQKVTAGGRKKFSVQQNDDAEIG